MPREKIKNRKIVKAQESQKYSWQYFLSPKEAWDAMYAECEKAKNSIELEQYILENDQLGRKFLQLFIEKAKEGVKVKVTCDPFGSIALRSSPLIKKLCDAGGIFNYYQPLKLWHIFTPRKWFPRTHVKTLIIDNEIIYSGGVCNAQRMKNWRDTHIRVTGPILKQARKVIDAKVGFYKPKIKVQKDNFYYIINRPSKIYYPLYKNLVSQIKQAEKYIYISTAFFIPNRRFLTLLKKAVKRGVDVRIITSEHSDVYMADLVALSYLKQLSRGKVRIFYYQKQVYHCKTAVIDDKWGTVGSMNMDILSFFYNREANIIITEEQALAELKGHFAQDLNDCIELNASFFAAVPKWKWVAGYFARSLKIFFRKNGAQ